MSERLERIKRLRRIKQMREQRDVQPRPTIPQVPVVPEEALGPVPEAAQPSALEMGIKAASEFQADYPVISPLMDKAQAAMFGEEVVQQEAAKQQRIREQYPVATGVADLATAIAAPGGVKTGMAEVGLDTALHDGDTADIVMAAGSAGVLGKAGQKVGEWLGFGLDKVRKSTKAGKEAEAAAGLEGTQKFRERQLQKEVQGKIKEGETGQLLLDKNIVKVGDTGEEIYRKLAAEKEKLGEELGKLRRETPTGGRIQVNDITAELLENLKKVRGQGAEADKIRARIRQELSKYETKAGALDVDELMADKMLLGRKLEDATEGTTNKKAMEAIYGSYADVISKSIPKENKAVYQQLNKEFEQLAGAEKAALKRGVVQDSSLREAGEDYALARGDVQAYGALKGRGLWKRYGNALKASGFHKASKVFNNPKWAAVLTEAAARGGAKAVTTADFLLRRRSEEYREMRQTETEKEEAKKDEE